MTEATRNRYGVTLPAEAFLEGHSLLEDVRELASERFGGRLGGTPECRDAADWIARRLGIMGLVPGGTNGTFFQSFPNPYTCVLPGGELTLHGPAGRPESRISYRYERDYFPGGTSGSGSVTADVVYAGYGVTAPELGYDDYAGLDVRGKIVLVEPEVPPPWELEPGFDPRQFPPWRPHSFHQAKMNNAAAHGAAGMLYHYGPLACPYGSYREGFLVSLVGDSVVADLFAASGRRHGETLAAIRARRAPDSFATGRTVTMANVTEHHPEGTGVNVVGLLPGGDPRLAGEALVVGAHVDHCGRAWELLPGANDDASGVAVALGVASALAARPEPLRRPLVFAFFGGEEQGFLGSEHYCDHPTVALEKTAGMINMDLVGVGERFLAFGGGNYPTLWDFFARAARDMGSRPLVPVPVANVCRPRLDGAIFGARGVPTISFAGAHSDGTMPSSHTGTDTAETIQPEALADLARVLSRALADMDAAPALRFR